MVKLCEVASQSLNVTLIWEADGSTSTVRSGQWRAEETSSAAWLPEAETDAPLASRLILPPFDMSCFLLLAEQGSAFVPRPPGGGCGGGGGGPIHLNGVARSGRLVGGTASAHSGQLVIAVRGAVVDFLHSPFHPGPISRSANLRF